MRRVALAVALVACLSGCATILNPERRGQKCERYKLDVPPALLDSALLLVGLVPGAVALGVDAGTGALWQCADPGPGVW